MHLGGYGFVDGLMPDPPGRAWATCTHRPGARDRRGDPGQRAPVHAASDGHHPFAVDLSSGRVRLALSLLDGVRQGQSLGTLLGYRFERSLHERGLARFIDDFRGFAPQPVAGAPVADGPAESVATRNVVDGLALQRRWVTDGRALAAPWPGLESAQAVAEVLGELDNTVHAIGDALLAESVFQTARGNPVRAAAALDAAAPSDRPAARAGGRAVAGLRHRRHAPAGGGDARHRRADVAVAGRPAARDARAGRATAERLGRLLLGDPSVCGCGSSTGRRARRPTPRRWRPPSCGSTGSPRRCPPSTSCSPR